MKKKFTVKVFINSSAPIILNGANDYHGLHIVIREASGSGYEAIPAKLLMISPDDLRALPQGSGADFEYKHPLSADGF